MFLTFLCIKDLFMSSLFLSKLLNCSVSQFLRLYKEDVNGTFVLGLLWGLDIIVHRKCLDGGHRVNFQKWKQAEFQGLHSTVFLGANALTVASVQN